MKPVNTLITHIPNGEYHAKHGVSSSAVKSVFKKSVAHWKGEKRSPNNPAFAMGTAVHANLLEKERNLVVKGPKTKSSAAFKTMKDNLDKDQVLLTEVEFNVANCIAKGALANPVCAAALNHKNRVNEVSIFVEDPISGLTLKTRPDLMIESEGTVYDVKTTQDASPSGFLRECLKYGYFLQGAHYVYTCQLADLDITRFSFIACEKSAPYLSHMHVMGKDIMEWATAKLHETLDIIANAEEKVDYGTGWGDYTVIEKPDWL
jgi:exodeoxyribonuclease VIII